MSILYKNKLPAWLSKAYTDSHINLVLRTLTDRESLREKARSTSRHQSKQPPASSTSSPDSSPANTLDGVPQEIREHYSVTAANDEHNIRSNRYLDVVPYDRTRVIVGQADKGGDASGTGRYLNANWVLERNGHKWWIATQAPLPTTIHAFLSAIFQPISKPLKAPSPPLTAQQEVELASSCCSKRRVRTVVQLTKNVEKGRTKAHPYFPSEIGKSLLVPPDPGLSAPALKVTLLQTHNHYEAQCIRSTVAIAPLNLTSQAQRSMPKNTHGDEDQGEDNYGVEEADDQRVIFQHLLYTAWPDHGVPEEKDRASLLAFLKLVDQMNRDVSLCSYPTAPLPESQKQYDPDPPIMVGCSAGIGRTGSFIALSSLLRHSGLLLPTANPTSASVIPPSLLGPLPEELAGDLIAEEIDSLREQRPRMVERPEQVLLIYELLIDSFLKV